MTLDTYRQEPVHTRVHKVQALLLMNTVGPLQKERGYIHARRTGKGGKVRAELLRHLDMKARNTQATRPRSFDRFFAREGLEMPTLMGVRHYALCWPSLFLQIYTAYVSSSTWRRYTWRAR